MPEMEKCEMQNWLDPKVILVALGMVGGIVAAFYAVKTDLAQHETRIKALEQGLEWQWKTIDALRNDLTEVRQDTAVIKNILERNGKR